jgi:hypothetical protein
MWSPSLSLIVSSLTIEASFDQLDRFAHKISDGESSPLKNCADFNVNFFFPSFFW